MATRSTRTAPAAAQPLTLKAALAWRSKQAATSDARNGPHYARHRELILKLHFLQNWPGQEIAKYLQAGDPALKTAKLNTITKAICELLRKERKNRTAAA